MAKKPYGPIRRSQLIVPFGTGAIVNVPGGTSLVVGGLDFWFPENTIQDSLFNVNEFRIEEWRLQKRLKVDHFRLPPDYREPRLWEKNIQLVTSTFSPDPEKAYDRSHVWLELFLSEIGYEGIHEKTTRGIITKLSKGEYFFERPPFGYEKDRQKIRLRTDYKPIIKFIFSTFIQTRSYAETARYVNDKYKKLLEVDIQSWKIKNIIMDRIYIGYLSWNKSYSTEG